MPSSFHVLLLGPLCPQPLPAPPHGRGSLPNRRSAAMVDRPKARRKSSGTGRELKKLKAPSRNRRNFIGKSNERPSPPRPRFTVGAFEFFHLSQSLSAGGVVRVIQLQQIEGALQSPNSRPDFLAASVRPQSSLRISSRRCSISSGSSSSTRVSSLRASPITWSISSSLAWIACVSRCSAR
jgi:hypothetical protein